MESLCHIAKVKFLGAFEMTSFQSSTRMRHQPQIEKTLTEIMAGQHARPLSVSQGLVYRYLDTYVAKTLANTKEASRELQFLEAAEECAVDVVGTITTSSTHELIGFLMPFEKTLEPH